MCANSSSGLFRFDIINNFFDVFYRAVLLLSDFFDVLRSRGLCGVFCLEKTLQ